jgi:DNA repair exonuclease SbcCD ATPase subunit
MSFKCIHISDIHFRGLKRHQEYKNVFEKFFVKARELNPDVIYLGGDIVHSKTQGITPEIIEVLTDWFNSLAEIAPVHVILGNHDGLILNEDRQDAITPIINAINNKKIHLYKKSGTYPTGINGFNWCVFSCFDEQNWSNVKPVEGEINIALYHGGVLGSTTDINWEINGEVELSFFDPYDFALLGDIHKFQYLDVENRIAYPGSPIQQNFGEDVTKGFLFWDIKSKNDYSSVFFELENDNPFLTLEWQGTVEKTIQEYKDIKSNARLRIRSDVEITQFDIQELHKELKATKSPLEITYKIDVEDSQFDYGEVIKNSLDVKKEEDRKSLLKSLYTDLSEDEINEVSKIYDKLLIESEEDTVRYKRWKVNSLKFDNTFTYGKNNYINFDNMSGIIGIFGKNRTGKSSIPGTLMYALFNASDRGALKNLHIINNRKGECNAEVTFTVDDNRYTIARSTKKKESKKGSLSATTKLEVYRLDKEGKRINESEEQRRETEKVLKSLLGEADDFLYTGFASQGSLNSFISEKSTARKNILSKFLDLNVFDKLYEASRDEYAITKDKIKKATEKNWSQLTREAKENIENLNQELKTLQLNLENTREEILSLMNKQNMLKDSNKRHKTGFTYDDCSALIESLEDKKLKTNEEIKACELELQKCKSKIEKIVYIKENFPIESLKQEKSRYENLTTNLNKITYQLEGKKKNAKRLEDSLVILNDIPCENKFKSCKFIADANKNKSLLPSELKEIEDLSDEIENILFAANQIKEKDIDTKIKKYNEAINKEFQINVTIKSITEKKENLILQLEETIKEIDEKTNILKELKNFTSKQKIVEIEDLEKSIKSLKMKERDIDSKRTFNIQKIASLETNIKGWEEEKADFISVSNRWKYFEVFLKSIGKKGIPNVIISHALPTINKEISNILNGVVNFKVTIEPDSLNNLDIFVNYGDSKRIIECCSGMEKMMSSIAIRVALINISNLTRPDMFIMDEGFGALDDSNIEACNSLLNSLKKYFKTILIISHVDAVKEIVDSTIEITSKGKDAYVRHV